MCIGVSRSHSIRVSSNPRAGPDWHLNANLVMKRQAQQRARRRRQHKSWIRAGLGPERRRPFSLYDQLWSNNDERTNAHSSTSLECHSICLMRFSHECPAG
ncbi:hypothetical protein DPMN_130377 [Dreissena polymorpha]|uniref:Uncharacterized protein n=1 Tax=Dreissena polymorpha TaxID=45954 RepID=A0A9D4H512_DREPO|nr:hypothetical protein DPMN_130377 [Dreissena polymorpha]